MKRLSKILAAVVAVALVLALAVPALAAGSITVLNPGEHTYTAYKIFDVTDDGSGNLSYTVEDPWMSEIIAAVESGTISGLQIYDINEAEGTGKVAKLDSFKAAEFAEWAKTKLNGKTAIPLSTVDGKMTTGDVAPGYYLVVPDSGDLASLCTVLDEEVGIQNKNDMPFDKVVVDDGNDAKESDVQVGDTLNFKIEGKVPDTSASSSYFYLVSDRLSEGLTLTAGSVTVNINNNNNPVTLQVITDPNAELTGNQIRYITDTNGRLCGFDLSLDMKASGLTVGADIVITYTATVNEAAINVISTNEATLDYGDENHQSHKDSMTKHYTSRIVIDKYETGSPESKVEGAVFALKDSANKYYKYVVDEPEVEDDPTTAEVDESSPEKFHIEWVTDLNDATKVTTNAEGSAEFIGLKDGNYTLVEVEAPAGYTALTDGIPVTVDGSDSTAVGLNDSQIFIALSEFVRVANTPGSLLPSTGGMGTYLFYIVGGVLVVAALAAIIVSSRKRSSNN
ncbi:MAG: SpaH/EbpB family LPXTG-anchored major pilin [Clostridia bacterium]|nr:SpaH/EbpB family LPXTG-anchored major pilin [Clostridia bacterium]